MKKNKSLLITFIVVVVLAIIAIVFFVDRTGNTTVSENFAVEDTLSVDMIFLADKFGSEVTLERKDGYWSVNNSYVAREDLINVLLKTIKEVKVKSPVPKSQFDTQVRNLSTRSIKVEIYQDGDLERTYYVGGATKDQQGTYMLMEGSAAPFITYLERMSGYLTPRYCMDENLWRDQTIFKYKFDDIKEIVVEFPTSNDKSVRVKNNGDNTFEVSSLMTSEVLLDYDIVAVKEFIAHYKSVKSESVILDAELTKEERDSIVTNTPLHIISVKDIDGITKSLKIFKRKNSSLLDEEGNLFDFDPDRAYAYIDDKDIVKIQYMVFDPLVKELADFKK